VILLLIVAALFYRNPADKTGWQKITKKFSKELNTQISFKHISFSLFNKLNLEDFVRRSAS
jgi:hypothetical protein